MMDAIPALILRAHGDGSVDFINQRWLDYTGVEAIGLLGWGWRSVIHPEDVDRFVREWRIAMAEEAPFENEARVRGADGTYRWFLGRSVALRDGEGKVVKWYGTMIDIDDRKRAESGFRPSEAKLRQDEMELQQLVDAVPQHVFVLEADGRILYANQRARDYTGLSLEDTLAPVFMSRLLHPDDQPRVFPEYESAIERGAPWEVEARFLRKDGQYRWFLARLNPMRNQNGTIIRWYGTSTDIEDRKHAEDRVRAQEAELRQMLDLVPQHVAMLGAGGECLYLNLAGLDYLGLTLEEWRAEVLGVRVHPDDREHMLVEWRRRMEQGTPGEIELRLRRKDGQFRWRPKPTRCWYVYSRRRSTIGIGDSCSVGCRLQTALSLGSSRRRYRFSAATSRGVSRPLVAMSERFGSVMRSTAICA
jgi:PAS domain S-box-containing protein